jgi:hypothetical protein
VEERQVFGSGSIVNGSCDGIEIGEPGGIRTLDPRLKRPLLYQLSYRLTRSPSEMAIMAAHSYPKPAKWSIRLGH